MVGGGRGGGGIGGESGNVRRTNGAGNGHHGVAINGNNGDELLQEKCNTMSPYEEEGEEKEVNMKDGALVVDQGHPLGNGTETQFTISGLHTKQGQQQHP